MLSQMLPEAIRHELNKLDWIGEKYTLQLIRAGAVNHNFCLTAKGKQFFLKCFAAQGPARLDRQRQFALQHELAAQGFAPKPLYLSVRQDFMLEQWLDSPSLMDSPLNNREKVAKLAQRLAAIHDLPVEVSPLDLLRDWQFYLQKAGSRQPALMEKSRHYGKIWQALDKRVFCHHDLSFGHICLSEDRMTLDWEYAALSCPFFDLANAILVNGLSRLESQQLCQEYATLRGFTGQFVSERVEYVIPLAEFTNHLWYLAARAEEKAN
ncbi:choline/ethanolamine kinase family protein [Bowmanella dokdonensis]|uniref:Phosphotransferase family protein n=1 Tax=Bowmanella dokdonensis TaxID=751969 RepID=A0A939DN45_9ALTE|nr:choline/ethanolamine kinase family protein [Bowmanella dokdonensis]MBN7824816.1 phosphotransferase family protein [Bowmanella dokdonensis]